MTATTLNIRIEEFPAFVGLGIQKSVPMSTLPQIMGGLMHQVMDEVKAQGLEMRQGFNRTLEYKGMDSDFSFMCGSLTTTLGVAAGDVVPVQEIARQSIIADYFGPFEALPNVYAIIMQWSEENKVARSAQPIEFYMNDPSKVASPAEYHTRVVWPLAY